MDTSEKLSNIMDYSQITPSNYNNVIDVYEASTETDVTLCT